MCRCGRVLGRLKKGAVAELVIVSSLGNLRLRRGGLNLGAAA